MEKIIINTEENIKELALAINGRDCILKIDTHDIELVNVLVNMCADIINIQKKYNEVDIEHCEDVEVVRAFANETLALSDSFYERFCKVFPAFQEATKGICIRSFAIWRKIMFPIAKILEEAKEKKLEEDIKFSITREMDEELE